MKKNKKKRALILGVTGQDGSFMAKLLIDKNLSVYKNLILTKRSFKPYQLNLDLEKLLQDKNITSHSAWIRLFDDIITSLKFSYKKKIFNYFRNFQSFI